LRRAGAVAFAAGILTGWARIHVGVHFPADIPAGLLLALVLVAVFGGLEHVGRRVRGVLERGSSSA
jgi:undecaprenyl-diphosphatase